MILRITRGNVRVEFGGRTVTIDGEAFLPGYGSPDFVLDRQSLRHWDPPFDDEPIDDATREEILLATQVAMAQEKGMTVEIE